MWQANEEQKARIKALTAGFEAEIPALCDLNQDAYHANGAARMSLADEPYQAVLARLEGRLGRETLAQSLPEFIVFPDETGLPRGWPEGDETERRVGQYAVLIASEWIAEHGGAEAIALIAERLRYLIGHLEEDPEVCNTELANHRNYRHFHTLHIEGCARLLARMRNRPMALDSIEDLLRGRWDGWVKLPETAPHYPNEGRRYEVCYQWLALDEDWREKAEPEPEEPTDGRRRSCLKQLYAAGRLDYPCFADVFRHLPHLLPTYLFGCGPEDFADASPFERTIAEFLDRLAWEAAQEWNETNIGVLRQFRAYAPRGGRWLVKACEHTEALGLAAIGEKDYSDTPMQVLARMAGPDVLAEGEDTETLAGELKRFKEKTLVAVLPLAQAGEAAVLRALGWEDLRPVMDWIRHTAGHRSGKPGFYDARDVQNSDSPLSGVIDRAHLLELLAAVDAGRVKKLVAALRGAKLEVGNTLALLEAAAGWNRKKVESSVAKDGQTALKAYGLLPLERGEEEALERYLRFKQAAKECTKYGAERQGNTRGAVQAGLANLAQTAGYPDLTRLEWAMEARVADEGVPLGRRETLGDWEVELTLDGLEAKLQVFKEGKPLKSVPAGLRKLDRYLDYKDTQARLKAQGSRFRPSLEAMMAEGDGFTPEDLRKLSGLAVLSRLLRGLILRTEAGEYGFFDPEGSSLTGLGGQRIELNGEVRIAHPYHFFRDGVLPDWQREVVRRRIVQPFKQAFRELYILTPAEEDSRDFSKRFAGHSLKSNVASRLLQARGWKLTSGDGAEVFKRFRKAGLVAEFEFPDAGHYLAESDIVTSDRIRFLARHDPMPLAEVPPLIFSEVMRDADLVVSVAQADERDDLWTAEGMQRRADLVTALVGDLGLSGVRCEGHFAYVTGKRASYRVHLGSAVIHIEPGNYLCVVPDRSAAKADAFFLPFADAEPKASEVISKILLLANDDKIKDKSILAQIEAATR